MSLLRHAQRAKISEVLASDLKYEFFVTAADAAYFSGFDLVSCSGGISGDQDVFDQILDPNLFSFELIDNRTVLQATLNETLAITTSAVPDPSTWAMMLMGFAGVGYAAYRRSAKSGRNAVTA